MDNIIRVGLGLLIFNDKHQVLLGLRKSLHGQGTWCPPGGHLEYGETFEEGASREAFEETGLSVAPEDIKVVDVTNDFFKESGKHYVTIMMQAENYRGSLQLCEPEKCEKWQWFEINNLPDNLFLSAANFLNKHRLAEFLAETTEKNC